MPELVIEYQIENDLSVDEFKQVLIQSTLAERRPITEEDRLKNMLKHANLIVTARYQGKLIGVSRSLSDFSFCTYLSDLTVDVEYQHKGIGKALIQHTKLASPLAKIILLAAPDAVNYYPKIGMTHFEFCYFLKEINDLH